MVRAAHQRSTTFYVGCSIWALVSAALIFLDLGVIAFVGSMLLAIWVFGLREKFASDDSTASAYSVFNQRGKAIPGGFTAQQFERQMRGVYAGGMDDPAEGGGMASPDNTTRTTTVEPKVGVAEKLRRRQAAAAAAERRVAAQQS